MTQDEALRLFEYRDGHLYWRVKPCRRDPAGMKAGFRDLKRGYVVVTRNRKHYYAHQVVFLMHHGVIPPEIDHINGDRADNRIENLRAVTRSQNQYNKDKCRNKTSGHRGVSWHKPTNKWAVRISLNNRNKSMGYYDDLELAAFIAEEARLKYYGQYAKEANHVRR